MIAAVPRVTALQELFSQCMREGFLQWCDE